MGVLPGVSAIRGLLPRAEMFFANLEMNKDTQVNLTVGLALARIRSLRARNTTAQAQLPQLDRKKHDL